MSVGEKVEGREEGLETEKGSVEGYKSSGDHTAAIQATNRRPAANRADGSRDRQPRVH